MLVGKWAEKENLSTVNYWVPKNTILQQAPSTFADYTAVRSDTDSDDDIKS